MVITESIQSDVDGARTFRFGLDTKRSEAISRISGVFIEQVNILQLAYLLRTRHFARVVVGGAQRSGLYATALVE